MNPRRRRRLRNQRQDRKRFHQLLVDKRQSAERSRRAQADKAALKAERRLGPGMQVIPEYAIATRFPCSLSEDGRHVVDARGVVIVPTGDRHSHFELNIEQSSKLLVVEQGFSPNALTYLVPAEAPRGSKRG